MLMVMQYQPHRDDARCCLPSACVYGAEACRKDTDPEGHRDYVCAPRRVEADLPRLGRAGWNQDRRPAGV